MPNFKFLAPPSVELQGVTHTRTDGRTDGLTFVGARDACASKKTLGLHLFFGSFIAFWKVQEIIKTLDSRATEA